MLYLWPYMLFFSFPITLRPVIGLYTAFSTQGVQGLREKLPRFYIFILATLLAATAVRYNTIIHPFTLADNRHYVFYVFRILLRHPVVKYLATPVYVLGGYIIIQTLGNTGFPTPSTKKETEKKTRETSTAESSRTSFVIVWLATTALSLITAPLVEPRYCIVPWILWRLHVSTYSGTSSATKGRSESWWRSLLMLETVWFCIINLGTGYLFLHRGFAWEQEPGNIQRFMW
jgi:alpha-1,2-glucosyltransferase